MVRTIPLRKTMGCPGFGAGVPVILTLILLDSLSRLASGSLTRAVVARVLLLDLLRAVDLT
ncbi:hypothetical protein GCM10017690_26660 [Microbacterium terregens]